MPTYEFKCDSCNVVVEFIFKVEELETPNCELCKSPMHRVYGAPGIVFKGTGFYKTGG